MMPIFRVLRANPNKSSMRLNKFTASVTSSGPCILGLTMYMEPVREFFIGRSPRRSCSVQKVVKRPSMNPSGISSPCALSTAEFVIKWPTLRTKSKLRPGKVSALPSGRVNERSGCNRRVTVSPPFLKVSVSLPVMSPSQLR